MNVQVSESIWLGDRELCSLEHLAEVSGLSTDEVRDLIDCGVIVADENASPPQLYQLRYVTTAIAARRLRDDFLLGQSGVALALTLLERIRQLEAELNLVRPAWLSLQHDHRV